MDFPETLATLWTQDTGREQTKHKSTTHKTNKRATRTPQKTEDECECWKDISKSTTCSWSFVTASGIGLRVCI
jgi:hypothetical protein